MKVKKVKIENCLKTFYGDLKKIIILMFLFIFLVPFICYADDSNIEEDEELPELVMATSDSAEEPNINSRAAIIYDRNSKEIIYGKEENTKRKMASTTKILTSIVVIENGNLSDTVTASKKAAGTGGSRLGLKVGDKATVQDLLYGLMLRSGNDAAVALAEHVGGSIEGFAQKMNDKAKELDLKCTHLVTPHGLDNDDHYTTAYELAKITDYALNNKIFANIVGTKSCTIHINNNPRNLSNTNELLGNLPGVYGVKTGFTNGANRCLVTATKSENIDIITVVLGADTKKFRTSDSIKLINYAKNNYKNVEIKSKINEEFEKWKQNEENKIYVNKGEKDYLDIEIENIDKSYITVKNNQENDIKINIQSVNILEAPIKNNTIVGVINVTVGNQKKLILNIITKEDVSKKNIVNYFIYFAENYTKLLEKSTI